jgi:hypothetical protein
MWLARPRRSCILAPTSTAEENRMRARQSAIAVAITFVCLVTPARADDPSKQMASQVLWQARYLDDSFHKLAPKLADAARTRKSGAALPESATTPVCMLVGRIGGLGIGLDSILAPTELGGKAPRAPWVKMASDLASKLRNSPFAKLKCPVEANTPPADIEALQRTLEDAKKRLAALEQAAK